MPTAADSALRPVPVGVDGARVGARVCGDGPPVVLLHGFVGSSAYWTGLAAALAPRHTVLALDLPGHGASARPRSPLTLDAAADVVAGAAERLGAATPAVVGHSLGAAVALAWAAAREVRSLVLASPVGLARLPVRGARLALPVGRLVCGPLAPAFAASPAARRAIFGRWVGMRRLDALDAAVARSLLAGAAGAARSVPAYLPLLAGLDVRPLVARVDAPALVVWGAEDGTSAADGTALAAALRAPAAVLPGVGHMPMLEDPDGFAAAVAPAL